MFYIAPVIFISFGCGVLTEKNDESNIEEVLEFFYSPGRQTKISAARRYNFFSAESKNQIDYNTYKMGRANGTVDGTSTFVNLLRLKDEQDIKYAIVSITEQHDGLKNVYTDTWVLEKGKWRLIRLEKDRAIVTRTLKEHKFVEAINKSREWIKKDPFSTDAYDSLAFGLSSMRNPSPTNKSDLGDIVDKCLAINPEDTACLRLAVSESKGIKEKGIYLKRLEGSLDYSVSVYNVAKDIKDPKQVLDFLKDKGSAGDLDVLRLTALCNLEDWNEFNRFYNEKGQDIRINMDKRDTAFSSDVGGVIGMCLCLANKKPEARKWFDYIVNRDPSNDRVKELNQLLSK